MTLPSLTLVLGGARSGKSAYAEAAIRSFLRHGACRRGVYVATAQAFDDEMRQRIAMHRERRGTHWETLEEPFAVPSVLRRDFGGAPMLLDCLTLWLSNILLAGFDLDKERADLLDALRLARAPVVCVANEVGLGIVPDNPLARRFRDEAGRLNQALAVQADSVVFLAAGLPLFLKGGI